MKLAKDWEQQRKRVKWLSTSFGLGRMLAEFETHDGKKHSLYAATSLELLGKVRAAIDEREEDPVAKEIEKIVNEESVSVTQYTNATVYELLKKAPDIPFVPPKKNEPSKPKPAENPYRRKFG